MVAIAGSLMLVRFKKRNGIKGECMMLAVNLMRKYLSVKRPTESSRQDGDE